MVEVMSEISNAACDKVPRGSNASRTAAMRTRVINAAIDCLHERGYAASTTTEILKRAGVSRGAMLHHFPTKVDLMLATAAHIVTLQTSWYDEQLARVPNRRDRYLAITSITWQALKQPTGMALLEVFMATRSDPELARRFPPVAREIEKVQHRGMWMLAKDAGITDRAAVRAMTDMGLATIRGLSIQLLFSDSEDAVEHAMAMFLAWERTWIARALSDQMHRLVSRPA